MSDKYNLSQNDRAVMDIIWEKGESTNADVLGELQKHDGFTRDTVKTYIRRLREKALVGVKKLGPKKHIYYPLLSKDEYLAEEAKEFLNQNYVDLTHMIAGLVDNEKISIEEIQSLEQYIKELKEKNR
ncbi:MAG: BlaI/MecI/CopY family transcriptional regulator [Eubacteriales bacterium]